MNQSTINIKNKKKTNRIKYLNIALIVLFIGYLLSNWYNKLVPIKYALVLGVIFALVTILALLVRKKWFKWIVILLDIAMIVALVHTQNLFNQLFQSGASQTFNASVVVLKDSSYQTMDDLKGSTITKSRTLNPDLYNKLAQEYPDTVNESTISEASDSMSLVSQLFDQSTPAIIIDEANRAAYNEQFEGFDENTRVISKTKVVKKLDIQNSKHPASDKGFSILISGIDTNGPISTVSRSDVNIVMTVDTQNHEIYTVSVPRDTFVYVPCIGGSDKLTHSGIYGIDCTMETLSNLLETRIDYYAKVNFTSFIDILNVVGSIEVNSHYEFYGHKGTYFSAGPNTLNADEALEFSRTRKTVEGGDYTRGAHQQEVIKAVFFKIIRSINIGNMNQIVSAIEASMDTNINQDVLSSLIQKQITDSPNWNFNLEAITGTGDMRPTALYPNQDLWVSYPDESKLAEVIAKIASMK